MPFTAFPIPTTTLPTGANRILYKNDSDNLETSDLFFVNQTSGVMAVCYPGSGSSTGFYIMPNGSTKTDTSNGPWLGGMIYGGAGGPGLGIFGDTGEPEFYIKATSFVQDTLAHSAFIFGRAAPFASTRLGVLGLTDDQTSYALAVLNRSATNNIFLVRSDGQINFWATNTAAGTTGAQTINKPSGKVNFAAAAQTLVVTNALCTTASIILANILTDDATAKSVIATPGSGTFTLKLNAAATAETAVGFLVIN